MDIEAVEKKKIITFAKPKELNLYYRQNPEYFDTLVKLLEQHPSKYSIILNKKGKKREPDKIPEYRYLNEWINDVTKEKLGDPFYATSTKCFWIINDIRDFPKCSVCGGNQEWFRTRNVHVWTGYHDTCSIKCKQNKPESMEKRKRTCIDRYGCENAFQSEEKKAKIAKTKLERYGNPDYLNPEKSSTTRRLRAAEDPDYKKRIQARREATMIKRFGVRVSSMSEEHARKAHRKYEFNGLMFDSSAELAFYIWAAENGRRIKRPFAALTYMCNGKDYRYFPDFYDEDTARYIEIKGDQFFDKNGMMYVPWRDRRMTDRQHEDACAKAAAKYEFMLKSGVLILKWSSDEVQTALRYVRRKYGRKFIASRRYWSKRGK